MLAPSFAYRVSLAPPPSRPLPKSVSCPVALWRRSTAIPFLFTYASITVFSPIFFTHDAVQNAIMCYNAVLFVRLFVCPSVDIKISVETAKLSYTSLLRLVAQ